jgi:hypothetical protein
MSERNQRDDALTADQGTGGTGTLTRQAAVPGRPGGRQAAPQRFPRQRPVPPRPAGRPPASSAAGPGASATATASPTAIPNASGSTLRTARVTVRTVASPAGGRLPFFVLLCGLLSGALVSALVISTTLAEGSFEITKLQQADNALARQRQDLQEQVATAQSAQMIEQRAYELGMRPVSEGELRFLNLKTGQIQTDAGSGAVSAINVPGYTP